MKRLLVSLAALVLAVGALSLGCAPAAPAPAPTKAPAPAATAAGPTKAAATVAPTTKPAEPTRAPTVPPTAAPAAKVDFPAKGKSIEFIVPYAAGGPSDMIARTVAATMEKILATPIQVTNKAGASTQIAMTDLVKSKPDGYTIALTGEPTLQITYMDPEAKAVYSRKDFQPIAVVEAHSVALAVAADGPYKTTKDLVDAARARPEQVKLSTTGMLTTGAIPGYMLAQAAGVKFAFVHFDGAAPAVTALLGGHADASFLNAVIAIPHVQGGRLRVISTTGREDNKFLPGIKTLEQQGYKAVLYSSSGIVAPAGTPKAIVDILTGAVKKALEDPECKKKMEDGFNELRYMDPVQYGGAYWDEMEAAAKLSLALVRGG